MSKQVNVTVYRYEELSGKAKTKAENLITQELLEQEEFWMNESFTDFKRYIVEDQEYTSNQLPDNICYQWDFIEYLGRYEGTKSGKWLIDEFIRFLNRTYENIIFEEKDVIAYTTEFELWFFEDGSLFNRTQITN